LRNEARAGSRHRHHSRMPKRGDIGANGLSYAQAYLTPASAGGSGDFEADCLRSIAVGRIRSEPFVECANRVGKVCSRCAGPPIRVRAGCRTRLTGNRWFRSPCDLIAAMGAGATSSRLNAVGAVVGATMPHEGHAPAAVVARSIILAPGLSAQGGDPRPSIHCAGAFPATC